MNRGTVAPSVQLELISYRPKMLLKVVIISFEISVDTRGLFEPVFMHAKMLTSAD